MSEEFNPYAAPEPGTESGGTGGAFALGDEVRKLVASTAALMVVASVLQLIPTTVGLVREGFTKTTIMMAALTGVVPVFVAVAGLTLRGLARAGDDRGTLIKGFRQLHVAFAIKGVALILILVLFVLGFLGILTLWS